MAILESFPILHIMSHGENEYLIFEDKSGYEVKLQAKDILKWLLIEHYDNK